MEKKQNLQKLQFDKSIYDNLDFTEITDIREDLLSLLSPSPLFLDKDFKQIIQAMYKSISKKIPNFFLNKDDENNYNTENDYDKKLYIEYNDNFKIDAIVPEVRRNSKEI